MSAAATHVLHRPGDSPVHRLPPHVKIVCAFTGMLCVVATSRDRFWAFGFYLAVVFAVWIVARVPVGWYARRALIESPLVVLAVTMPFVGTGPRISWHGLSISMDGALAGWNILAKGTLGVLIALTLAATTHPRDLLHGLQRLRVPNWVTTIAGLMVRYVDVIIAEESRLRVARISRGHDPRFLWQAGATARGIGTLFLRSYERGERVHMAMVSRGFTGVFPAPAVSPVGATRWAAGMSPAITIAAGLAVVTWMS